MRPRPRRYPLRRASTWWGATPSARSRGSRPSSAGRRTAGPTPPAASPTSPRAKPTSWSLYSGSALGLLELADGRLGEALGHLLSCEHRARGLGRPHPLIVPFVQDLIETQDPPRAGRRGDGGTRRVRRPGGGHRRGLAPGGGGAVPGAAGGRRRVRGALRAGALPAPADAHALRTRAHGALPGRAAAEGPPAARGARAARRGARDLRGARGGAVGRVGAARAAGRRSTAVGGPRGVRRVAHPSGAPDRAGGRGRRDQP